MPKVFIVSDNHFFKLAINELVRSQTHLVKVIPIDSKTHGKRKLRASFLGVTIIDGSIHTGNSLNDFYSFSSRINSSKIVIKGNISELILSSIFIDDPTTTVISSSIKEIQDKLSLLFKSNDRLLQKACKENSYLEDDSENYKFFIGYCQNHKLTSAEMKVLFLSLNGSKITDISENLGLKNKSISAYKSRALKKLGVSNNPANVSSLSSLFNFNTSYKNEEN